MDGLHIEDRGGARWLTLDRPDCRNALTPELVEHLASAVRDASSARCVVLAGRNGAFCSGLDLRVAASQGPALMEEADAHLARFQAAIHALVECPAPTVAVLDGAAYGFGSDLALACDLRVASTRAYFQEGFVRIGLLPDGGGTWMLPRLVGLPKALELCLLGERLEAAQAERLGLLARLCPPEELCPTAQAVVDKLVQGPPLALRAIKRLLRDGLEKPFAAAFKDEGAAQVRLLRSGDAMEGILAFFQKRPADFTGT
ncbi:MAG: enoyl-CoA hydratase/isomerase family protein [Deltaproteobacteria bacterium]|nr:enoyl-CoA hydratase/isomerase family protein [Deltaproteobacteria bacterium]